ncbi:hypothetical protein [Scytonema sp. NUACC26]|uniref:hypothetical protein n=1 Tax=Scytonema sp. NUACC26 TaxID=3140176 RepID=UPI0038B2B956
MQQMLVGNAHPTTYAADVGGQCPSYYQCSKFPQYTAIVYGLVSNLTWAFL